MEDLFLSPVISNSMVIQRDTPFPIWSKKNITVTFLGKTYHAKNISDKWLVTLDSAKAGGPFEMEIISDSGSQKIHDIYIGDVWLCSGQSNMEMQMQRLRDDFSEEWETKEFPVVRQFNVPQEWDFSSPREEISGGSWACISAETLHSFSATAWFFAKNLYEKHRIPIGLVLTAWGGTPIEAWMSEEALADYPAKIAAGKQYADISNIEKIAKSSGAAIQEWETNLTHEDTGIAKQWQKQQTDISGWDDINLPGDFSDAGVTNFCGAIWIAKEFDISENFESKTVKLWLGTIVDADIVYINGVEIGNTGYRYPPRKYIPDGLIKQGKNRIVIRITCINGEGGVTCDKPFRIFTDNETVELSGTWKYKIGARAPVRPGEFFFQRQPMGNFNAMIAPVLKFPFKGVIWYQGESNDSNPHDYALLFPLMINDWRKKSGNKELPFLFVQLPIWKKPSDNDENSSWATIREAQQSVMSLPVTGMACAMELGEWNDIHPINKKDVGYRLFLAAEKTVFGVNNSSPGPTLRNFKINQEKIYLHFDNCADGLIVKEKTYLTVMESEGQSRLPAEIEGKDIISVDISSVKNSKKILYAWADNPRDRQLFNSDGLPALPFKIELL